MLVLILEDEPLVALSIEDALQDAGHQVLGPVSQFDKALALAEKRQPDVLFTNLRLREDDGVDCARTLFQRYGIPAVFVTGSTEKAMDAKAHAIGFLQKPCRPAAIRAAVAVAESVIEGRKPDGAGADFTLFQEGVERYFEWRKGSQRT